ncbi:hypothetical protein Hypma_003139 [Hypsizygus marmoreus]|uniref:Uncharacterized protein n=1 Tax=Hypsizygus marmoreus TaxID=39966 RepID=A0A369J740_HYPMA|nr:hypothetical protein Hypma_003139 [Hypsizygus marmoreus]
MDCRTIGKARDTCTISKDLLTLRLLSTSFNSGPNIRIRVGTRHCLTAYFTFRPPSFPHFRCRIVKKPSRPYAFYLVLTSVQYLTFVIRSSTSLVKYINTCSVKVFPSVIKAVLRSKDPMCLYRPSPQNE